MNQAFYLVAGLGKTGLSIARYLHNCNKNFIAYDTRISAPGIAQFKAEFPNTPLYLEELPEEVLNQLTDVIASPGLALDQGILGQVKQKGIAIYGDIECLALSTNAPIIAITGTNGKSTVTTLVGEMAKAAGYRVAVAGNIGTPVLDLLQDDLQYDLWVLELSSFQLDLIYSLKPIAATVLNVTEDHLDRHHTLEAYIQSKHKIYQQAQTCLFNREDPQTIPFQNENVEGNSISFGESCPSEGNWGLISKENTTFLAYGSTCLVSVDSILIKGVHNWLNALAAAALAQAAGVSIPHIVQVLTSFTGLPHRCQWVRTLQGVDWINDSKGTNVGATLSAINGIGSSSKGKIVLIAGGQGKGASFYDLQDPIKNYVRSIILIGQDADRMENELGDSAPILRAPTLEQAVISAKSEAKEGDVVLLSPACASLDMFQDFNHRGDVFVSAVMGL